jgi:hypothetical protein
VIWKQFGEARHGDRERGSGVAHNSKFSEEEGGGGRVTRAISSYGLSGIPPPPSSSENFELCATPERPSTSPRTTLMMERLYPGSRARRRRRCREARTRSKASRSERFPPPFFHPSFGYSARYATSSSLFFRKLRIMRNPRATVDESKDDADDGKTLFPFCSLFFSLSIPMSCFSELFPNHPSPRLPLFTGSPPRNTR